MFTWQKFLESRAFPGADVYFDEIRFWLCGYPQGEPASLEQITKEEARLERIQGQHGLEGYNAYKTLQVKPQVYCSLVWNFWFSLKIYTQLFHVNDKLFNIYW